MTTETETETRPRCPRCRGRVFRETDRWGVVLSCLCGWSQDVHSAAVFEEDSERRRPRALPRPGRGRAAQGPGIL